MTRFDPWAHLPIGAFRTTKYEKGTLLLIPEKEHPEVCRWARTMFRGRMCTLAVVQFPKVRRGSYKARPMPVVASTAWSGSLIQTTAMTIQGKTDIGPGASEPFGLHQDSGAQGGRTSARPKLQAEPKSQAESFVIVVVGSSV